MAQGYWWDQQIRNLILVPGNEWISALSKLESITISIVLLFHINSLSSKHQAAIISDSATNLYCPSYIPQGFIVATAGEGGLFSFKDCRYISLLTCAPSLSGAPISIPARHWPVCGHQQLCINIRTSISEYVEFVIHVNIFRVMVSTIFHKIFHNIQLHQGYIRMTCPC